MSTRQYFAEGILNVFRSARIILAIYLVSVGLSIPLAIGMRNVLEHSLDSSRAREKLRSGFDLEWYGEFEAAGSSFARTFGPSVIGILPVAGDLERILDGTLFEVDSIVLLPAAVLLLVWAFLGGGIIARYSRRAMERGGICPEFGRIFFPLFSSHLAFDCTLHRDHQVGCGTSARMG